MCLSYDIVANDESECKPIINMLYELEKWPFWSNRSNHFAKNFLIKLGEDKIHSMQQTV